MDLFVVACQGIGLALAAGIFAGASGRRDPIGAVLLAIAIAVGALLFGASLAEEDHPAWPGWPVGALLAWFAFTVTRDVAAGAASRDDGGMTAVLLAAAAVVLAAISLLFGPLALLALAALAYLALARRRRAGRKYEGLRTLR